MEWEIEEMKIEQSKLVNWLELLSRIIRTFSLIYRSETFEHCKTTVWLITKTTLDPKFCKGINHHSWVNTDRRRPCIVPQLQWYQTHANQKKVTSSLLHFWRTQRTLSECLHVIGISICFIALITYYQYYWLSSDILI